MGYKALTKKGEGFISSICASDSNTLLSGSNNYRLIFSNDPVNTVYTALPKNSNGNDITTNAQLGISLIKWFNEYAKLYSIDANIIAAQAYVDSEYKLWSFPSPKFKTSAQGISQLMSSTIYDIVIGNVGQSSTSSILFTNEEINKLTVGLTDPKIKSSYIYTGDGGSIKTAEDNRTILFQNCMNNPDLMIKAQCKLIKSLSDRAANNAASTLFGYKLGAIHVRPTFTSTLKNAEPNKLSSSEYDIGMKYIDNIFRRLSNSFGYDIDFTFDEFTIDVITSGSDVNLNNISKSTKLSLNYTLGELITTERGEVNTPTKTEFNKLKIFAEKVLEPLNAHFGVKFIINSSFRSDAVNAAVKGSISSQHKLAEAADIRIETDDIERLYEIFKEIVANNIIDDDEKIVGNSIVPYDQLIFEEKAYTIKRRWIHISYDSDDVSSNKFDFKKATLVNGSMKYEAYIP